MLRHIDIVGADKLPKKKARNKQSLWSWRKSDGSRLDIPELKIAKDGVSANIKINRDPPGVSRLLKSALLVCHRLNQHQIPTKGTLPFYFIFLAEKRKGVILNRPKS
jgi:hypothetical protein